MQIKEPILSKTYDFLKEIIPTINSFPRDQRHILGNRIELLTLDILETLVEAYYTPKAQKKPLLTKVNLALEKLRFLLRISYEMGYFNSKRYSLLSGQLLEIGRMTGGWIKSL